ncbi:hypothetical protein [Flavobacterium sp.]|uniref:hypothetical protein n=1 Tax=Flavobacterium sp. TaxID=239 RepID=UPI00286F0B1D|nr:hypothetical protein [Flavobacterium sp.]
MKYTLEEIYALVGKQDKTATVSFRYNSDSYKLYGQHVTVVFVYTQKEREELDKILDLKEDFIRNGYVKARYLGRDLSEELTAKILTEGINSEDITEILYFIHSEKNTFHSKEKRTIKTINIPITLQENGKDFDWIYGFQKRLVKDNIGFSPYEKASYLAAKYYYEPNNITEEEKQEVFENENQLKEEIEWHYLYIKYMRKEISPEEEEKLSILLSKKKRKSFLLLDKYLIEAGSSAKKLNEKNLEKAAEIFEKIIHFKDKKLNSSGKKAIYINVEGYLHIYMRHVEEMKVTKQFEDKDNFQWKEEDVFTVIKHVIQSANDDIQSFFEKNPNGRYSKYGDQSLYFEGDYYTFHIEKDGRISTFHKNKKK